jgi:methylglyoxal/glyoxal reductase
MKYLNSTKLSNGVEIPLIALGTWESPNNDILINSILNAFNAGYKSIDTAAAYGNEESVGEALKKSGLNREEYFITTKVWNSDHGYDNTIKAYQRSLDNLKLDYVDLLLIHWPGKDKYLETWRAFEDMYKDGKIKAIGVSNFKEHHLKYLFDNGTIKPMVNQIEFHPYLLQEDLLNFSKENEILVEAWSPLMHGQNLFKHPVIVEIAKKYNKSSAQVILKCELQLGLRVLPKSVHKNWIEENIDVFDFSLNDEDMKKICSLNKNMRSGPDPDTFFMGF